MRLHQALGMWFCISYPGGTQASTNIWNRYIIYLRIILLCTQKPIHIWKISKTRKHLVILSHILMLSHVDSGLRFAILYTGGHCSGHPGEEMRQYPAELLFNLTASPSSLHISTFFL